MQLGARWKKWSEQEPELRTYFAGFTPPLSEIHLFARLEPWGEHNIVRFTGSGVQKGEPPLYWTYAEKLGIDMEK